MRSQRSISNLKKATATSQTNLTKSAPKQKPALKTSKSSSDLILDKATKTRISQDPFLSLKLKDLILAFQNLLHEFTKSAALFLVSIDNEDPLYLSLNSLLTFSSSLDLSLQSASKASSLSQFAMTFLNSTIRALFLLNLHLSKRLSSIHPETSALFPQPLPLVNKPVAAKRTLKKYASSSRLVSSASATSNVKTPLDPKSVRMFLGECAVLAVKFLDELRLDDSVTLLPWTLEKASCNLISVLNEAKLFQQSFNLIQIVHKNVSVESKVSESINIAEIKTDSLDLLQSIFIVKSHLDSNLEYISFVVSYLYIALRFANSSELIHKTTKLVGIFEANDGLWDWCRKLSDLDSVKGKKQFDMFFTWFFKLGNSDYYKASSDGLKLKSFTLKLYAACSEHTEQGFFEILVKYALLYEVDNKTEEKYIDLLDFHKAALSIVETKGLSELSDIRIGVWFENFTICAKKLGDNLSFHSLASILQSLLTPSHYLSSLHILVTLFNISPNPNSPELLSILSNFQNTPATQLVHKDLFRVFRNLEIINIQAAHHWLPLVENIVITLTETSVSSLDTSLIPKILSSLAEFLGLVSTPLLIESCINLCRLFTDYNALMAVSRNLFNQAQKRMQSNTPLELDEAALLFRQAIECVEVVVMWGEDQHAILAKRYEALAACEMERKEYEVAIPILRKSLESIPREWIERVCNDVGGCNDVEGEMVRRVVRRWVKVHAKGHSDYVSAANILREKYGFVIHGFARFELLVMQAVESTDSERWGLAQVRVLDEAAKDVTGVEGARIKLEMANLLRVAKSPDAVSLCNEAIEVLQDEILKVSDDIQLHDDLAFAKFLNGICVFTVDGNYNVLILKESLKAWKAVVKIWKNNS
ncbi:hypothetical protein HK096_011178, partial [Nowakowskiella sp. JEL0078]